MRVHVVSDVHGRADALARAGDGADALICLGDLLLFVDYADHGQGIFPDLFGAEAARELIALRTAQRFDEARAMSARLWAGPGRRPGASTSTRPCPGSTPSCSPRMPDPGLPDLRQRRRARGCGPSTCGPASTCSTASGSSWAAGRSGSSAAGCARPTGPRTRSTTRRTRPRWPRSAQVDVLCAHIPPDRARAAVRHGGPADGAGQRGAAGGDPARPSRGTRCSATCTSRWPAGCGSARTECVNVGHFRATGRPSPWSW